MFRYQYTAEGLPPHYFKWILPFVFLDLILKGFSLWRAARKGENWWFVALLIVNSLGILPAVYLLTHRDVEKASKKKK